MEWEKIYIETTVSVKVQHPDEYAKRAKAYFYDCYT
jgi:hypothetical protein